MFRLQRHWPNAIRPDAIVDLSDIFGYNRDFKLNEPDLAFSPNPF